MLQGVQQVMRRSLSQGQIKAHIDRSRDILIDLDLHVDAARADVERALEALRGAVRERNRAADHLAHLMGCARLEAA